MRSNKAPLPVIVVLVAFVMAFSLTAFAAWGSTSGYADGDAPGYGGDLMARVTYAILSSAGFSTTY